MKAKPHRSRGFSLIEVLVATAILAILLVLVAQILGVTTSTSSESRQRLAADREARLALDRLAFDLCRSLLRPDIGFSFASGNGNDSLAFYSEVPGKGGGSSISAVGYRIRAGYGLERASVTVPWSSLVFDPSQPPVFADADYRVLAPGVIRLEAGYLMDGDYSDPGSPNRDSVSVTHAHDLPTGASRDWVEDLRAVVVSIAVVDDENYRLFEGQWEGAATNLGDGAGNSVLDPSASQSVGVLNPVLTEWDRLVKAGSAASVPGANAAIRLYSRVIQMP